MARLRRGSLSSRAARAKVRRGWAEMRIGLVVLAAKAPAAKSPAITAAADERSAASRCWASSTKTRLSLLADCRLETVATVMELSPRRGQPSFSARSRRVCFMVVYCRFPGRVCTTLVWGRGSAPSKRGEAPLPHRRRTSVQRGLAWGARFPAAVHPEPLVGIAADEVFYDFRESCGVGYYVGLVIVGAN